MVKIRVKISYLLVGILLLLLLINAAIFLFLLNPNPKDKFCDDYKWINSQMACKETPVISKSLYTVFKKSLNDEINNMKSAGKLREMAIYFRDMENGPRFTINEVHKFIPASLLKVPIMMTYFKLAEDDQDLLDTQIVYGNVLEEKELTQNIDEEKILQTGNSYTIDELIYRMIAYSDNSAKTLLLDYLKNLSPEKDVLEETYLELGMIDPENNIAVEVLDIQIYASLFRLLFNVSYLSSELSDKALNYLASSDYANGLRRGVPDYIPIAHKFGERWLDSGEKQLHDCGLIYYPDNPYLLCVMTEGGDLKDLADAIAQISGMFYEEINSRKIR